MDRSGRAAGVRCDLTGQTEITDLQRRVGLVQQHVLRLYITVNVLLRMQVFQGAY